MEHLNQITAQVILGIILYKFILGSLAAILGFIAVRTENKVDDGLVKLLNKLINVGKKTVAMLR